MSVKTEKEKKNWLFSLSFGLAIPGHFRFLSFLPCAAEIFLLRLTFPFLPVSPYKVFG